MKKKISILLISAVVAFIGCSRQSDLPELIDNALNQYRTQQLTQPYVAPAAYIETGKCGDIYCMYTEGYGFLFSAGYQAFIPIDNFSFLPVNMKKSDRPEDWLGNLAFLYAKSEMEPYEQTDFFPGFNNAFSAFRWFEENGPFFSTESFHFEIGDTLSRPASEHSLIQVHFNPKGVQSYSGYFLVDEETFAIKQVRLNETRFFSGQFHEWLMGEGEIEYGHQDGDTYFSSINFRYKRGAVSYSVALKSLPPLARPDTMTDEEQRKLSVYDHSPIVEYQPDDWNPPLTFPDVDYESIRVDLEKNGTTLEAQFANHSGAPFVLRKYASQDHYTSDVDSLAYEFVHQKTEEYKKLYPAYSQNTRGVPR